MTSYRPQDPALREKYLQNSFTPLRIWEEDAMQSVLLEKKTSNHKFGGREWMDEYGRGTLTGRRCILCGRNRFRQEQWTTTPAIFFLGQINTCLYRCSFTTQRGNSDRKKKKWKEVYLQEIKGVKE